MDQEAHNENRRRVRVRIRTKEKVRLESPGPTRRSVLKMAGRVVAWAIGLLVFAFITFRVLDSATTLPKRRAVKK